MAICHLEEMLKLKVNRKESVKSSPISKYAPEIYLKVKPKSENPTNCKNWFIRVYLRAALFFLSRSIPQ
jgi:hypothetical protein